MSPQDIPLFVPDGYYPPYAVITDTDHGGYIIIAVALGLTFVLISSVLRIALRIGAVQKPGLDDTFLAVATVSKPGRLERSLLRKAQKNPIG